MIIQGEKINKRDIVFVSVLTVIVAFLLFIPSDFTSQLSENEMVVRVKVLETDNSGINQFGIVKQGDQSVKAIIENGSYKGQIVEANNLLLGKMEMDKIFAPGDMALGGLDIDPETKEIIYTNLIDHYRINVEFFLLILFAAILVIFAGWTGAKAIISFVFSGVMIWKIMLPLFLREWNPILLSLGVVTVLTAVIILLIGGINKRGLVAFLGAFSGIIITCLLSMFFGAFFNIHGAVRPFSETLLYSGYPNLDLRSIFLAGIFLASSGAVMDVAMDIAASMREIQEKQPNISKKELILSGFTVGRAIIGTMTTTLLLAYSGGYTTMLMVFLAQGTPLVNILNLTYVSAEILHTLVGSFGLVLVAPLTALIGGILLPMHITLPPKKGAKVLST